MMSAAMCPYCQASRFCSIRRAVSRGRAVPRWRKTRCSNSRCVPGPQAAARTRGITKRQTRSAIVIESYLRISTPLCSSSRADPGSVLEAFGQAARRLGFARLAHPPELVVAFAPSGLLVVLAALAAQVPVVLQLEQAPLEPADARSRLRFERVAELGELRAGDGLEHLDVPARKLGAVLGAVAALHRAVEVLPV